MYGRCSVLTMQCFEVDGMDFMPLAVEDVGTAVEGGDESEADTPETGESQSELMKVLLTSIDGPTIEAFVPPSMSVDEMKRSKFFARLGVPGNSRVIFGGKELCGDMKLSACGIGDGAVVHIVPGKTESPYAERLRALGCAPSTAQSFEARIERSIPNVDTSPYSNGTLGLLHDVAEHVSGEDGEVDLSDMVPRKGAAGLPEVLTGLSVSAQELRQIVRRGRNETAAISRALESIRETAKTLAPKWCEIVKRYCDKLKSLPQAVGDVKHPNAEEFVLSVVTAMFVEVREIVSTRPLNEVTRTADEVIHLAKERLDQAAHDMKSSSELYGAMYRSAIELLVDRYRDALAAYEGKLVALQENEEQFRGFARPQTGATIARLEDEIMQVQESTARALSDLTLLQRNTKILESATESELESLMSDIDALNHERDVLERQRERHVSAILSILEAEEERVRRLRRTEALLTQATRDLAELDEVVASKTAVAQQRQEDLEEMASTNEKYKSLLECVSSAGSILHASTQEEVSARKHEHEECVLHTACETHRAISGVYPLMAAERNGARVALDEERERVEELSSKIVLARRRHLHDKVERLMREQEESNTSMEAYESQAVRWDRLLESLNDKYDTNVVRIEKVAESLGRAVVAGGDTPVREGQDHRSVTIIVDGDPVEIAHPHDAFELEETRRSIVELEMEMEAEERRRARREQSLRALQEKMMTLSRTLDGDPVASGETTGRGL